MNYQERELPSLLFTPRPSERHADVKPRSPRSTRSPSTPAFNRNSGFKEGSISKRRSITPHGSGKDTPPPPPPAFSLLDENKGVSSQISMQSSPESSDAPIVAQESTSYGENEEYDAWVTVYGFQMADQHMIYQEFSNCGLIQNIGSGRDDRVNWVHIRFSSIYSAERALAKNGVIIGGKTMVGVKKLEGRHYAAADVVLGRSNGNPVNAAVKIIPSRPYSLDNSGDQAIEPTSSQSTWSKLKEFTFGR